MTTFLLVRHARTELPADVLAGRMPGVHLSPAGTQQAEQLAQRLAALPVAAIYSSPLARALQTARILAAPLKLPVQVSRALTEIDFGEWAGKRFDELAADPRWQAWNTFRSGAPAAGGEYMAAVQWRAVAELQRLSQQYAEQVVAVVSHSDVIKAVIAHYLGVHLDLFQRIEISPASVSVLAVHAWGARVLRLNDTGDLSLE